MKVDPRVGGGDSRALTSRGRQWGRSPRGRGRRPLDRHQPRPRRSIPAWAGETAWIAQAPSVKTVDPRVGGGDLMRIAVGRTWKGRSPRGRGRRRPRRRRRPPVRSIPAWAGETQGRRCRRCFAWVDPRVGGGDATVTRGLSPGGGRSPRGRGRPGALTFSDIQTGSIPAWAGETSSGGSGRRPPRVDPRVGGGDRGGLRC